MVINNLHIKGNALVLNKTDSPLVINANAVLTYTSPVKHLEAVSRRDAEVIQVSGIIEHTQFASCHLLNIRWQSPGVLPLPNLLGLLSTEVLDHAGTITYHVI